MCKFFKRLQAITEAVALVFVFCFFIALPAKAQSVPTELDLGGIKINIPNALKPIIQAKMQSLKSDNEVHQKRLEQADLFLPIVGEVLEEQGIPEVFKYLALLDRTNEQDRVFWQLPEKMIRSLGLQDEGGVDESANSISVAKAVAQQLKQNQGNLKNWLLTLIAYHEGAGEAKKIVVDNLDDKLLQNLLLNKKLDLSSALHPDVINFIANWAVYKNELGRNPDLPTTLARYKNGENKTLFQIAEQLKINPTELANYNEWIEPDQPIPAGKEYEVILPLSTGSPSAQVEVERLRGGELEFNTYEEDMYAAEEKIDEETIVQKTHTVKAGETLFAIARKYSVSVGEIRQWNLLQTNHVLKAGEELKIEGNAPKPSAPTKIIQNTPKPQKEEITTITTTTQKMHTVKAGETLSKIARVYSVSVGELKTWNRLTSDGLKVGQKIVIKSTQTTVKPSGAGNNPKDSGEIEDEPAPKPTDKPIVKPQGTLAYSQRILEAKTVPSEMVALGLRLKLNNDAKQKVQNYVNKLIENQPAYFKQLELVDGYMPLIERELQKAGLPLDFRFLPIQESALKATAVSKSNAVGYWQFKKESAVEEGIIVNEAIDERMNIVASTLGAISYLEKSQIMFGNWVNSLLSYNMGRTGAKNQIAKTYKNKNLNGVSVMDITGETHWYVLKFLAHLIAYNDELGISTPNKILTDYTQGAKKTLLEIAKENKTTVKDIAPHNQWLRTSAVPVGKQFSVIVIKK